MLCVSICGLWGWFLDLTKQKMSGGNDCNSHISLSTLCNLLYWFLYPIRLAEDNWRQILSLKSLNILDWSNCIFYSSYQPALHVTQCNGSFFKFTKIISLFILADFNRRQRTRTCTCIYVMHIRKREIHTQKIMLTIILRACCKTF